MRPLVIALILTAAPAGAGAAAARLQHVRRPGEEAPGDRRGAPERLHVHRAAHRAEGRQLGPPDERVGERSTRCTGAARAGALPALIEENGRRIAPDKLAQKDRDRQQDVDSYVKAQSSESQRQKAAREHGKARRRSKRRHRRSVSHLRHPHDPPRIDRRARHHPRHAGSEGGVRPQTDDGKIMRNFKARAWISESDYELVRIEIEAIDDLSFGMGLLARVHKGTVATFERRKVNNEVWLPAKVTWTASGRVLLLRRLRLRGMSEFSAYRKFTVDTSATFGQPK